MPWFFSGKGWQLTCVQHTRRLIRLQHTKYYSRASCNRAAHEDGSRAAHEIELACSTRKITLVSHASSVRVTRQKYKNTCVLPHASVNLEMSCTVEQLQTCFCSPFKQRIVICMHMGTCATYKINLFCDTSNLYQPNLVFVVTILHNCSHICNLWINKQQ